MVSFSVTGGNPTDNDIDLEFDLEASTDADSYGEGVEPGEMNQLIVSPV